MARNHSRDLILSYVRTLTAYEHAHGSSAYIIPLVHDIPVYFERTAMTSCTLLENIARLWYESLRRSLNEYVRTKLVLVWYEPNKTV